ncbi:RNA-binding protein 28 [Anastrepha obliqua]|uniref:RNA-binding protein 28 n=1 Tax=Anastrepha obliqua TaxID=95512 RepID=UPI002409CC28|nr:RNA-binding protein 28 [Anastrepha obliqua]
MELSESVKDEQNAEGNAVEQPSRKRRNPFLTSKEDKERRQKKKARIVVRNISYKANEDLLSKHFSQWGNVEELNLLKRPDGKLVGCAFVQYSSVNQASKAILRGNKQDFLGRPIYVDWALGKDEYIKKNVKEEPDEKKPKKEPKEEDDIKLDDTLKEEDQDSESQEDDDESDADESADDDKIVSNSDEDEKKSKYKLEIGKVGKETHISNDVQDGCTIFIKNVPFDAENNDLRKIFRKFGLLHYAIINREPISGHSKGTAFVKFKNKESADLCLQSGGEISLMDQLLEPYPALSRDEVRNHEKMKSNKDVVKDSRNLYLAREGLIMANSKSAEGVSASDMSKRHKLEQIKTQVLKNLNRFVSRNRLSIHNLPLNYDNEKLKRMVITYTDFRPHECRVMRENKITPEHPQGKSKGFGFMSFSTHQEALAALRKLNNNPSVFGNQHRPIVAFSIEDRAVEKVKENRKQKSKINNPTFKEKLEKRKEQRRLKRQGKLAKNNNKIPYTDDKEKLKKHLKKLEESRAAKANAQAKNPAIEELDNFVGTASKPGSNIRLRSNKKIAEQAQEHRKNVKANKRKEKAKKIRQIHLAERKAIDRPKQGRKEERDDLEHLVTKYKRMIDSQANVGGTGENLEKELKAPKRTKWYTE